MFDPEGAALLADLLFDAIKAEDVEFIGGLETGAIPIVTALCARSWPEKPLKGFFVRKENKGHGTDQRIDGLLERGSKVILFEDVTTTGGSAMQAVNQARQLDCTVLKVVSVVDRLEGAEESFRTAGIKLDSCSPGVISVEPIGNRPRGGASEASISLSGSTRPVRQFGRLCWSWRFPAGAV